MASQALGTIDYRDERTALLFADSEAAEQRGRRTLELVGCRVVSEPIERAAERLARHVFSDTVLVEVEEDSPHLAPLLDGLEARARGAGLRSVVSAPEALIDVVAARIPHREIFHLCRPSELDRLTTIALSTMRPQPRLHDSGKEEGHALLQQLSDEMARMATVLASLADEAAGGEARDGGAAGGAGAAKGREGPTVDARLIRSIIRTRRLRDRYFKGGLFADPAWDMLLDLMAARLEGNRVAVSSLCIAAAVPPTTALRWIKTLTDQGVLVRCADPQDGRRVYIELSDEAARQLAAYIRAAQRIALLGI